MNKQKMFEAGVIGHFGFGKDMLNGQTIKTKIIATELEKKYSNKQVLKVDTSGGVKNFFSLIISIFRTVYMCKNIIVLPAQRGVKVIVPIAYFANLFCRRKLHYCVIGGWLPELLQKKVLLKKIICKFNGIYVETYGMRTILKSIEVTNVFIMPNCKDLIKLQESELCCEYSIPYRVCTFSRVMKEKGIEDAIEAVSRINTQVGYTLVSLDIYGQIEESQQTWFDNLNKHFPNFVHYKGKVSYNESVDIIKKYYALLFPTYYEGEGFAGTLLDAMASGVPIIASDWKYNSEIVNQRNGFLFRTRNCDDLTSILFELLSKKDIKELKYSSLAEYDRYAPQNVIAVLTNNF